MTAGTIPYHSSARVWIVAQTSSSVGTMDGWGCVLLSGITHPWGSLSGLLRPTFLEKFLRLSERIPGNGECMAKRVNVGFGP